MIRQSLSGLAKDHALFSSLEHGRTRNRTPFLLIALQAKWFNRLGHHGIIGWISEGFLAFKQRFQVMANTREPILQPIPILSLRPTQMTVGMREVKEKRERWREHKSKKKQSELLGKHMIPVVLGPEERHFVVDHHHLARALHEEGVKKVLVTVVANLRKLDQDAFWFVLENRSWMHPFDDEGRRRGYKDIPKSIDELVDDPFRSLAG